jgi:DNA polymerase III, epsilon subunit and related 3''-5'' exonucleases
VITMIRQGIVPYCQDMLDNPHRYAFFDTETTGLKGVIINAAFTDPLGKILFNGFIRPNCPIEASAQAVHGITEAMVADAPTFNDVWPSIYEAIQGRILVAWNVAFDAARLKDTARRHGIALPDFEYQCLMLAYAAHWGAPPKYANKPEPAWQKLEYACKQQGLDLGEQEHRALSDTMAMVYLVKRIAELGEKTRKYNDPSLTDAVIPMLSQRPATQERGLQGLNTTLDKAKQQPLISLLVDNQSHIDTRQSIGRCCRCSNAAYHASPSGFKYCDNHNECKNGHQVQWQFNEETKTWLCACYWNKDLVQKTLI